MGKKNVTYPSKTTLNLAIREKSGWRLGRVLPMFAALAAAVLLFGKFAVADRLALVAREQQALAQLQGQAAALEAATADFAEVAEEYGRYSAGWMTDEEKDAVDRIDILDLVEGELMRAGAVKQLAVSGNTLSADLSGVDLEGTSRLVERLYGWPVVSSVTVYTATTQPKEGEEAQVSLVVTLSEGGAQ